MVSDKISVRQICFILVAYNAVLKLIIMPTSLAVSCQNDLVFPAAFDLLVQTAAVWAVAFASSRTDKTFFQILKHAFNEVFAKAVYILLALYFILAAIIPMMEQQLLVHAAFYDTVPSLYAFLPFFVFAVYAGTKSFANVGRCADICMPVFALCFSGLLIMSVGQGDYSNLLPVLKQPVSTLARTSLSTLFKFSDGAFLLLFMGNFRYKKGDAAKITLSYALGGVAVIILCAVFYAVYGVMTPSRTFLLNEISAFFPAVGYVGRIDLTLLYAVDIVILFAILLYIQSSVHCLHTVFGGCNRAYLSLGVNGVLLVITLLVNNKFSAAYTVAENWFWIPALVFAYLLPVCTLFIRRDNE